MYTTPTTSTAASASRRNSASARPYSPQMWYTEMRSSRYAARICSASATTTQQLGHRNSACTFADGLSCNGDVMACSWHNVFSADNSCDLKNRTVCQSDLGSLDQHLEHGMLQVNLSCV